MNIKKGQIKQIVVISVIFLLFSIFVFASISKEPTLATTINGKSISTHDTQNYIKWYDNFKNVDFKRLDITNNNVLMKVGNFNQKLEGYIIDNKKYAIELMGCDKRTKGCVLKVNGISTGKIYLSESKNSPNSFYLNNEYNLRINSIVYDFCDNKRFCDSFFESYDLVEVEVVKK